jgi:DNA uptake protein ComE-like DNA-binding protein
MKGNWRDFFEFSKRERMALAVFAVLVGTFLVVPKWLFERHPSAAEEKEWWRAIQQIPLDSPASVASGIFPTDGFDQENAGTPTEKLRSFDPNQLMVKDWVSMGLSQRTARTIVRYVEKGGRFRQASDLEKIWGLRKEDLQRLLPFVSIQGKQMNNKEFLGDEKVGWKESKQQRIIDINTADSSDWTNLPGIGPVLSRRIVRFREMKGGFQSIDDLRKVYGLSDSVYIQIRPFCRISLPVMDTAVLNQYSLRQLMGRFKISYEVAQAIICYRKQHGSFRQLEELRKIVFINDSLYKQIIGMQ